MTARRGLTGSDTFTLEEIEIEATNQGFVTKHDGTPPFCGVLECTQSENHIHRTQKLNLVQRVNGDGTKKKPCVVCVTHRTRLHEIGGYEFAKSVGPKDLQKVAEAAGLRLELQESRSLSKSNGHSSAETRHVARTQRIRRDRTRRRSNLHRACTIH